MKRVLDIGAALGGILVFGIPMLVVAVIIRATSNGPAFYRSERIGLAGEPFHLIKFRTMVVGADQVGPSSTSANDPRITEIGAFLRHWKLDELPQLVNVVRGDMSLVGPRPQVGWAVERYSDQERRVLSVRPGMTDYASIRFRNEADILRGHDDPDQAYLELIEPEKLRLGLEYVDNQSIRGDLKIICATIMAVVTNDEDETEQQ